MSQNYKTENIVALLILQDLVELLKLMRFDRWARVTNSRQHVASNELNQTAAYTCISCTMPQLLGGW